MDLLECTHQLRLRGSDAFGQEVAAILDEPLLAPAQRN
jgi:hypothetical protein